MVKARVASNSFLMLEDICATIGTIREIMIIGFDKINFTS